jgi:hypothetical protein
MGGAPRRCASRSLLHVAARRGAFGSHCSGVGT